MDWIKGIILEYSALQALIVISLLSAIGLILGRIRIWGVSLGVTFVFFIGILAGHLGISVNADMLNYAESFGLVLFVYALGLQVGPGFFSSFRTGGLRLNLMGAGVVLLGTTIAIGLCYLTPISISEMVGILCGATTNTPALGAAQQALKQLGMDSSGAALGCAVAYPLGVVGVILALIMIRKLWMRNEYNSSSSTESQDHTFIVAYQVHNPGIIGKNLKEVASHAGHRFIVSRLWRDGNVSIPTFDTELRKDDRLLVITNDKDVPSLTMLFGKQEQTDWNKDDIDWNAIDSKMVSRRIIVTRPEINGKRLGSLRLRNAFGINITRIYRSGIQLLATPDLILQMGDRLTVVGEAPAVQNVEKVLGNAVKHLEEPNLVSIFIGITLGLILGSILIAIPGVELPVRLGLAGGPIVVGILIGTFGPRIHMITYTTHSANLMLRALGLSIYLACLGLDAGTDFFDTVFRPEGALWIGAGFIITFVPIMVMALLSCQMWKIDFGSMAGMLCGSMANPMALNYANDTIAGDHPAVSYATVYPLCMFLRVIIAQLIIMSFL